MSDADDVAGRSTTEPGGMAASEGQSEGGGEPNERDGFHSGYAPTDTAGRAASEVDRGHPQGMAADGAHGQGGGSNEDGERRHSGWGPVDGEIADKERDEH